MTRIGLSIKLLHINEIVHTEDLRVHLLLQINTSLCKIRFISTCISSHCITFHTGYQMQIKNQ